MTFMTPLPFEEQVAIAVGNQLSIANNRFDAATEAVAWDLDKATDMIRYYNLVAQGLVDAIPPAMEQIRKAFRVLFASVMDDLNALDGEA